MAHEIPAILDRYYEAATLASDRAWRTSVRGQIG
jgi:hypothetical protein